MRVLLDTHSLIWLVTDDPKLSPVAKSVFLDSGNALFCSAVVGLEIAVKSSLGKLQLSESPRDFVEGRIRNNGLLRLPVTLAHTYRLGHLPFHHRDPFDRLLVAQALEEDLALLSRDTILSEYGIRRLW